ncbi:Ig-like domain-containing protein [Methanobrevibacter sp.]
MTSIALILFLVIGAVSAVDSLNVSDTEYSNLIEDNDDSLSAQNKLEISSEDSISETNIVNSHDDNLGDYPTESLAVNNDSYYEDGQKQSTSTDVAVIDNNTLSSSSSSTTNVVTDSSSNDNVGAASATKSVTKKVSTKLSVSDAHYAKKATYFDVTLKDKSGNPLPNQKITLKVKGVKYSATTDKNGFARVKTASLAVGTYAVEISYAGSSNYTSSSLSKKVKVLSSISGSDLTKYYGYTSSYKVTFWKGNSVLANTAVSFNLNGKTYTKTTNSKGVAKMDIKLAAGKYTITAINPYSKEKVSHKIVVKKDKTTLKAESSKLYIIVKEKGKFTVTLKSKHKVLIKNSKIKFTYNNKTVTVKTNKEGKATLTIPVLSKGTYKITYKYAGNKNYYSDSGSAKIIVKGAATKISAKSVTMKYNDGSRLKVKLTTDSGEALDKEQIKIKVNGKTFTKTTDSKGVAKLTIKDINPGVYKAKFYYSTKGSKDYSHGSSKIIISKGNAVVSAKNLVMKKNDGSVYNVKVKDESGKLLKNVFVKSTIGSKSYIYQTNSEGVAKLKITRGVGYYSIKTVVVDPCYNSKTVSKHVLVNGTKFVADDMYLTAGSTGTYSIKVVDGKNEPIKKAYVKYKYNGKTSTVKTNSKGIAKIPIDKLTKGKYAIKYSHDSYSDSSKIIVVNKVTIKQIVQASQNVKKYVSKYKKLPSTVKVGDVRFPTAEYLYLASKAIVNLKAGNKKAIGVIDVDNPTSPKKATNLGILKKYNDVAKSVVKTAESKGAMPNSVKSSIGNIGYKGVVSIFADVLSSYGSKNKMPSYVIAKSLSGSSSSSDKLNPLNTIGNLAAYLAASTNCEVNNALIKELVSKLTKNCKTDKEKANAIYTYVRDTISYSFYYDTKYGAVGTLKAKSGNCVDHTHLLNAMFRASGLAARYVHGTCTFSSGSTYGHVWSQVLIGNTWTVADATSSRNSLGKVANWNTNSYKLQSISSSISF